MRNEYIIYLYMLKLVLKRFAGLAFSSGPSAAAPTSPGLGRWCVLRGVLPAVLFVRRRRRLVFHFTPPTGTLTLLRRVCVCARPLVSRAFLPNTLALCLLCRRPCKNTPMLSGTGFDSPVSKKCDAQNSYLDFSFFFFRNDQNFSFILVFFFFRISLDWTQKKLNDLDSVDWFVNGFCITRIWTLSFFSPNVYGACLCVCWLVFPPVWLHRSSFGESDMESLQVFSNGIWRSSM